MEYTYIYIYIYIYIHMDLCIYHYVDVCIIVYAIYNIIYVVLFMSGKNALSVSIFFSFLLGRICELFYPGRLGSQALCFVFSYIVLH